ncbi:MAG: protein phosphatase CheZ [Oleiphilaceae bacterium]|nr:protein phosphatase CheZ [Oleiphilaceae bacterium]
MTTDKSLGGATGTMFEETLKEQANQLKTLVDSGDLSGALTLISALNETRDKTLFQEVGKLTRSLHESIRNFQIDTTRTTDGEDLSKIEDASDRLAYVVDMTNKAANKTLDLVEDTMPMASNIRDEAKVLQEAWGRLQRKEMKPNEFRELSQKMETFLAMLTVDSDKVYSNLSDILLAQDFQDLTGQVINRVTGLVKEVEENLVNLVRMAGKVDQITGTVYVAEQKQTGIEGEGPQMKTDKREDVVSGQDDVDDLLSSLGF